MVNDDSRLIAINDIPVDVRVFKNRSTDLQNGQSNHYSMLTAKLAVHVPVG